MTASVDQASTDRHAAFAVSVVIPVRNGAAEIGRCLHALAHQKLDRSLIQVIVVDDGSTDGTAKVAADHGATVIRQDHAGAPAARDRGLRHAAAPWVAFTDCDCVPSRLWLSSLLEAVAALGPGALGATGRTLGLESATPAAKFVDLTAGLDSEKHLRHPKYPFASTSNVLYRREALLAVGGFDSRFTTSDGVDLHGRLLRGAPGPFAVAPRALLLHKHRATWREYWRQQVWYGRGNAQFYLQQRLPWSPVAELFACVRLVPGVLVRSAPGEDERLLRRGTLVKKSAQWWGFVRAYYSSAERRRWRDERPAHPVAQAPVPAAAT